MHNFKHRRESLPTRVTATKDTPKRTSTSLLAAQKTCSSGKQTPSTSLKHKRPSSTKLHDKLIYFQGAASPIRIRGVQGLLFSKRRVKPTIDVQMLPTAQSTIFEEEQTQYVAIQPVLSTEQSVRRLQISLRTSQPSTCMTSSSTDTSQPPNGSIKTLITNPVVIFALKIFMVIKIQRAWRRYCTRNLVAKFCQPYKQEYHRMSSWIKMALSNPSLTKRSCLKELHKVITGFEIPILSRIKETQQTLQKSCQLTNAQIKSPCQKQTEENNENVKVVSDNQNEQPFSPQFSSDLMSFTHLEQTKRQNLCEFIMIELCLDVLTDLPNEDSIFKKLKKALKERQKRLGIETNIVVCRDYLCELYCHLTENNPQTLLRLDLPLGPTPLEILSYMRENPPQEDLNESDNCSPILSLQYFSEFHSHWAAHQATRTHQNHREQSEETFVRRVELIHCRALFDCVNQQLDLERPDGKGICPYPWIINFHRPPLLNLKQRIQKLKQSIERTLHFCAQLRGVLPDKEGGYFGDQTINEDLVEEIRHQRLLASQKKELESAEKRWLCTADEETELMLDLGDAVLDYLMQEVAQSLRDQL